MIPSRTSFFQVMAFTCFLAIPISSRSWLNALPISSFGLCMDDDAVRIPVGLYLGVSLYYLHTWQLCGAAVNEQVTHGLSCIMNAGHQSRHTVIHDITTISFSSAQISSTLEPTGLNRTNGK